jgi:hypothetical protein
MNFQRLTTKLLMGMLIALMITGRASAMSLGISVNFAPPALPVFYQPQAPAPNLIWQPGYWAWGQSGYFWVPGQWAAPPQFGMLWTPGYWSWNNYAYYWHPGYWARRVGYYGGVDYGYGYYGRGYVGGAWFGNGFRYNTAITNVDTTVIHNVYVDRTVVVNDVVNRVSYHGGPGGIVAQPRGQFQGVRQNPDFHATVNNVRPRFAAAPGPAPIRTAPVRSMYTPRSTYAPRVTNVNRSAPRSVRSPRPIR